MHAQQVGRARQIIPPRASDDDEDELTRTPNGLGWGVRCSDPILAGQFVVEYVGAVMTDCEVEQLRTDWAPDSPALSYLFDLSHYYDKEAAEALLRRVRQA